MNIGSGDEPFADDEVVRGINTDVFSDDGILVFIFIKNGIDGVEIPNVTSVSV